MDQYKELKAYKGIDKKFNSLMRYLENKDGELFNQAANVRSTLEELKNELAPYYLKDEDNNYKRIGKNDDMHKIAVIRGIYNTLQIYLGDLKTAFTQKYPASRHFRYFDEINDMLGEDLTILLRVDYRDNLSLPAAVYKLHKETAKNDYVDDKFKWPGFYEYSRIYVADKNKTEADVLEEFIKKTPKQVEETYKKAIEKNPNLYEYIDITKNVPANIRNTSDKEKIDIFMATYLDYLSYPIQVRLSKQVEAANKIKEINDAAKEAMNNDEEIGKKAEVVSNGPDHAEIKINMPSLQTSGQGCWSCAAQMLIASRGISVTQEEVRAYRPKLTDDDVIENNDSTDYAYNRDCVKNLLEMGDNILSYAPNSMLHEVSIGKYTPDAEKKGITREKYINDTVALMKKRILHAIKVDHSPVALLIPDHYITITAIDGDVISYKDSAVSHGHSANHTFKMSLTDFLKKEYSKKKDDPKQVSHFQLTWISDVKLSKDEKTLFGVPSVYAGVNEDGSVKLPPEKIAQPADAEISMFGKKENGVRVYRISGDEVANFKAGYDSFKNEGVEFVDKVYMPKNLNLKYLKNMAKKRNDDEEELLKDSDWYCYKTPVNREAARQLIDNALDGIEPVNENDNVKDNNIDDEVPVEAPKEKISFRSIRDMSKNLYNALNKHEHFYMINRKESYTGMMEYLSEVTRLANLGMESAGNKDGLFKPNDVAEMVKALDRAILNARKYLDAKMKEFEADPKRKNESGKQGTEQNRIKEALHAYETMLNYKEVIDESFYGTKPEKDAQKDRQRLISGYRRKLVSEYKFEKMLQENTYHNRIDIPAGLLRPLECMEAIWGRNTEMLTEFEGTDFFAKVDVYNENTKTFNKINSYRKIKTVESDMIGIGTGGKNDILSNKDFAALACAASTMPDIFEVKNGSKLRYRNLLPADTEYYVYNHKLCEFSTGLTMPHDMTTHVDTVNMSKDAVREAMISYKAGNLIPLAKIIKNGITNLAGAARFNMLEGSVSLMYLAEMSERMRGMLDRDNRLMKEALKQGLKPKDISYIDTMREVGLKGALASDYEKQCLRVLEYDNEDIKEWTHSEKLERYTEMMLSEVYKGMRNDINKEIEINPDYIREMDEFESKCKAEERRLGKSIIDSSGNIFATLPEAKTLHSQYLKDLKEAQKIVDSKDREQAIIGLQETFLEDVKKINNKPKTLVSKFNEMRAALGDLEYRKMQYESYLKRKYTPENNILDFMSDHVNVENMRKRVKKYIVGNGYDKYSMRDFAQKVYSPNNQESVRYGMFFSSVLVAWEAEQKALKAMNKQMPVNDAQAGAVKNLPPKVIGEVNNRKHSASVNNKNTMKNAGKTRSKSTVIKSKPPGI